MYIHQHQPWLLLLLTNILYLYTLHYNIFIYFSPFFPFYLLYIQVDFVVSLYFQFLCSFQCSIIHGLNSIFNLFLLFMNLTWNNSITNNKNFLRGFLPFNNFHLMRNTWVFNCFQIQLNRLYFSFVFVNNFNLCRIQ